jgi:hypothetical protein
LSMNVSRRSRKRPSGGPGSRPENSSMNACELVASDSKSIEDSEERQRWAST